MIKPGEMKLIQIVITNVCPSNCCHCSQLCPHVPPAKKYFMSLDEVEQALKSLQDYPGHIGMFGGEPTLHPHFEEICKLYQKYIPVKARRELWTMGYNWEKYKDIIHETFYDELIAYNEHEEPQPCWHQPNNIAIGEVFNGLVTGNEMKDLELMYKIIDNCWVNLRWSAAITPMGAYFCEVASARAWLAGAPKGLEVKPGWWKVGLDHKVYQRQKRALCRACSMCLPMEQKANDKQPYDDVSPAIDEFLKKVVGSPKALRGETRIIDMQALREYYKGHTFEPETEDYWKRGWFKDFPNWKPNIYRPFEEKKHKPEDVKKR